MRLHGENRDATNNIFTLQLLIEIHFPTCVIYIEWRVSYRLIIPIGRDRLENNQLFIETCMANITSMGSF